LGVVVSLVDQLIGAGGLRGGGRRGGRERRSPRRERRNHAAGKRQKKARKKKDARAAEAEKHVCLAENQYSLTNGMVSGNGGAGAQFAEHESIQAGPARNIAKREMAISTDSEGFALASTGERILMSHSTDEQAGHRKSVESRAGSRSPMKVGGQPKVEPETDGR